MFCSQTVTFYLFPTNMKKKEICEYFEDYRKKSVIDSVENIFFCVRYIITFKLSAQKNIFGNVFFPNFDP